MTFTLAVRGLLPELASPAAVCATGLLLLRAGLLLMAGWLVWRAR